jgi:hypothetical protein
LVRRRGDSSDWSAAWTGGPQGADDCRQCPNRRASEVSRCLKAVYARGMKALAARRESHTRRDEGAECRYSQAGQEVTFRVLGRTAGPATRRRGSRSRTSTPRPAVDLTTVVATPMAP